MGMGKGSGALEFVEGLIVVGYGEVLVKGGTVFLGMCLLWWGWFLYFFWHDKWTGDNSLKSLYP